MSNNIILKPDYKLTLNGKYKVFYDDAGAPLDLALDADVGRTLIPLRGLFEEIGAKVLWVWVIKAGQDKGVGSGDIIVTKDNKVIHLKLNDRSAKVWENIPAEVMRQNWDKIPRGTQNIDYDILKDWQTVADTLTSKTIALEAAPQLINSKTYIPVRFVSEALGARVGWDQDLDIPGVVHIKNYDFADQRFLIFYDAAENELKKLVLEKNGVKEVFEFAKENRYADYKIEKADLKSLLELTKGHINIVISIREADFDLMHGRHGNGRHRSIELCSWETSRVSAQSADIDESGNVITFPITNYNIASWETQYGTAQNSPNIWERHRAFIKTELVTRTVNIIKNIIAARAETAGCKMPGIYIGAPHFSAAKSFIEPQTGKVDVDRYINEYTSLFKDAYDEIISAVGKDCITGIYFGNENPAGNIVNANGKTRDLKLTLMRIIGDFAHSRDLLYAWAPYGWFSGKSQDTQDANIYGEYSDHDKKVFDLDADSEFNYTRFICKIINRSIFDIMIMQPAHFYETNKPARLLGHIVDLATREGLGTYLAPEYEFDMSMVTGRGNSGYIMSPAEKKIRFEKYVEYLGKLRKSGGQWKTPIAVYAGGPNELGLKDTGGNDNLHSNANHFPYMLAGDKLIEFHKMAYSSFPAAKGYQPSEGNLIYEILKGILKLDALFFY